jgi:hypothetical protein
VKCRSKGCVSSRGAGAALHHGQGGLGAVEGLDLALSIDDAADQRLVRRIEDPDKVLRLGGKVLVVRKLACRDLMRLQSVHTPDSLDVVIGDRCCCAGAAHASESRTWGLLMQRRVSYLLMFSRLSGLPQQLVHPLGQVAAAPAAERQHALAPRRNCCRGNAIVGQARFAPSNRPFVGYFGSKPGAPIVKPQ